MDQSEAPILIITREYDPHADEVILALNQRGIPVIRIHPRDFPLRASAAFRFEDGCADTSITLPDGRPFSPLKVRSAWYRKPEANELPQSPDPLWVDFIRAQTEHQVRGLWQMMHCYWVSPPAALRAAEYKLNQLQLAQQLGLMLPKTLVTNNPDEVRQFYAATSQRVIYKPLRTPSVISVKSDSESLPDQLKIPLLYTTVLTDKHMQEIDSIRWAAGIFQEYVPKKVELRITIMGRRIFAVEMHTQIHERTRHDWRRYTDDLKAVPYYPHNLPSALENRLLQMVDLLGLQFGAIDMILTPDGEYVFLEINPNGQWLWMEDMTGLPMLKTLVTMLIEARPAEPV